MNFIRVITISLFLVLIAKQGVFADPKSKEFKKMIKDKAKAEKMAKKQQIRSESLGMTFARKYYKGDKEW